MPGYRKTAPPRTAVARPVKAKPRMDYKTQMAAKRKALAAKKKKDVAKRSAPVKSRQATRKATTKKRHTPAPVKSSGY